jgi:DNA-binding response OmpR family regulator
MPLATETGTRTPALETDRDCHIFPVLLLHFDAVAQDLVSPLIEHPRLEVVRAGRLSPRWIAFAQSASIVLMLSRQDPFGALLYAITAGIDTPIVVAMEQRCPQLQTDLMTAGAFHCLPLPLTHEAVEGLAQLLRERLFLARVDRRLRFVIDPVSRIVIYRGQSAHLTRMEFVILEMLSRRSGSTVAANDLLQLGWREHTRSGTKRVLDVHVCSLRRKLAAIGLAGCLATKRGFGYKLDRC